MVAMALAESRESRGRKAGAGDRLRERAPSYAAALVLTLMFMGATLPSPLYVIYRDELHFSQITLTLIYAVYFAGAMATAFFLGRISDQIGRRVAIFAAIAVSIGASLVFIFADSLEMLFVGRLLSGLALPLASGAGTAWIVELCEDRCTAASLSAGAILAGLGLGALISGTLAEYSTEPLVFPFIALVSLALAAAMIVWLLPETVKHPVRRWSEIALRPRIGVPRSIIGAFIAPAVTVFASFALLGFYSALAPSLLQRSLQLDSHAIGGAVIFELYAVATLVLALTHWLGARAAMLWGLALLIPALALLVVGFQSHSLPLLLTGAALGGGAAALGYRGSLQIVNQIAPENRRAELVSTYLMFCYAGVSLPVVGIGLLSVLETPALAEAIFAVVIAVFALMAIAVDVRNSRLNAGT
jgi:predicted MFS family arabinose efflux permease